MNELHERIAAALFMSRKTNLAHDKESQAQNAAFKMQHINCCVDVAVELERDCVGFDRVSFLEACGI